MGPMRFGLHSGQHRVSYAELRRLWADAARLGFDACYLFDHFVPLYSQNEAFLPEEADAPDGSCLEATATLAALARDVSRVGIGVMVLGAGYRNLGLLGQVVATLQQASAGRLEIGIGAGWFEPEYRSYGLDFPPARERLVRLEAALDALVTWWRGDVASVEAVGLRDFPVLPLRPMPRLWVAGTGERTLLRLAARYADSWNAMYLTPKEFGRKVEVLAEHCERAARPLSKIERSIALRAFCSHDRARAVAGLEELAARRGRDPDAVRARSLVGSPQECAEQLAAYAAAGANHVTVMVHPPYERETLELLAAEVFPELS